MPRSLRPPLCAAVLCASIGCTVPFRAGAPVEIRERWYGAEYRQDGKRVHPYAMRAALEDVAVARDDARASRRYEWAGGTLLLVGAAALGWGIEGASAGEGGGAVAVAAAGAGGAAAGLALLDVAFDRLEAAARAYNGQVAPAARRAAVAPWAAAIPGARDRCVAGGLLVRF